MRGMFREGAEHSSRGLQWFALFSLLTTAALYLSLPVPHTMALRNFLLLLSFVGGVVLIAKSGMVREICFVTPIVLLILLLAWVTFHAAFISQNGGEAWEELWGQWYKPYVAMVGGIGCALSARYINRKFVVRFLVGALMVLPLWFVIHSIVVWLRDGYLTTTLVTQYIGGFKHKLGFLPFVEIMAAFAFAHLTVQIKRAIKWELAIWLIPIVFSYYIALITDTKNSLLLLTLMSVAFILGAMVKVSAPSGNKRPIVLGFVIALVSVAGMYVSMQKSPQWNSFADDAKVALDIDGKHHWENRDKYGLPANAQNRIASESTYLRIAYAAAGLREIVQHPLGYGVTRHAFERLIQLRNEEAKIANSHSGYIDLVAAVGLPALLLLLAAEISLIKQALCSEEYGYMIWILGTIMVHWMVDPLSRDQHVYALFMLMGFFSTTLAMHKGVENSGDLCTR